MNGQLEALWLELFGQKITPIERVGRWFDQQPLSLWAEL